MKIFAYLLIMCVCTALAYMVHEAASADARLIAAGGWAFIAMQCGFIARARDDAA